LFGKLAFNIAALALAVRISLGDNLRSNAILLHDYTRALAPLFQLVVIGVGIIAFVGSHISRAGVYQGTKYLAVSNVTGCHRHRVVPFAAVSEGQLSTDLQGLGVTVASIPQARLRRSFNPLSLLRQYRVLRAIRHRVEQLVSRWQIDIIHANSVPAALAVGLSRRRLPLWVWHCRDLLVSERVIRWLGRCCAHIVAISKVVRRHLLQSAPHGADRITVIYNGIAPADFTAQRPSHLLKAEFGLQADTPVVATVGQLVPWKRHDLFIEAARQRAYDDFSAQDTAAQMQQVYEALAKGEKA